MTTGAGAADGALASIRLANRFEVRGSVQKFLRWRGRDDRSRSEVAAAPPIPVFVIAGRDSLLALSTGASPDTDGQRVHKRREIPSPDGTVTVQFDEDDRVWTG